MKDRAWIEARITELRGQREALLAQVHAIDGAIQILRDVIAPDPLPPPQEPS